MSGKKIYALYDDDDVMKNGAKAIVEKGIHINTVYSPFPVHGIEKIIGMKWTRIAQAAFLYGLIGMSLALLGMYYFMIVDWPMDIGGKPNFHFYQNLPSFIPITFEFTVLCTAHGMALTYFLLNWTLPGIKARNPHPRTTDDHFAIEVIPAQNHGISEEEIKNILQSTNPVEVFEK
ncbi:MAG: DUF3341 domain-containing protein [Bacteroidetes bacterium]|nr:MAG: DUF3341 domain-containing protein [Bacteroidota bacterium]